MTSNPLTRDELIELAEKCEAESSEGERELLGEAAYALWGDEADQPPETLRDFWDRATHFVAKLRAFAFVDAAMMLVPKEMADEIEITTIYRVARVGINLNHGADDGPHYGENRCNSIPLALCAAALRARGNQS